MQETFIFSKIRSSQVCFWKNVFVKNIWPIWSTPRAYNRTVITPHTSLLEKWIYGRTFFGQSFDRLSNQANEVFWLVLLKITSYRETCSLSPILEYNFCIYQLLVIINIFYHDTYVSRLAIVEYINFLHSHLRETRSD